MLKRLFRVLVVAAAVSVPAILAASFGIVPDGRQAPQVAVAVELEAIDALFERYTLETPGCAVGVADDGRVLFERGYGLANLEHAVPIAADTVFEAGSVSKQFTAAAILLLAQDGLLSLDDPVRRHVPELPDVAEPLTLRHLLTHTSGLRDWGTLAGIAGAPRTSRVYTHAHVVDILSRQQALNFLPGTRWSYSNSGYNLAAVIVSRVSGMSFAEFSRTRIFEPAGMSSTSWRDDFRRLVPGRATAYAGGRGGYRNMPFENVHGNGGLLTTVGDLLRWNENFVTPAVGGPEFVALLEEPGRLADGRALHYAHGLFVGTYRGRREVFHSGATAGYRAFLTRLPDEHLSIAVLCNAADGNPTALAHRVADLYLPESPPEPLPASSRLPEAAGPTAGLEPDEGYAPSAADLAAFVGTYRNDEIETVVRLAVVDGRLVLHRRPADTFPLRPHSRDRFEGGGGFGLVTFHRDAGRVVDFSVTVDRVWDLRFARVDDRARPR